jgi:hypothetical protein
MIPYKNPVFYIIMMNSVSYYYSNTHFNTLEQLLRFAYKMLMMEYQLIEKKIFCYYCSIFVHELSLEYQDTLMLIYQNHKFPVTCLFPSF